MTFVCDMLWKGVIDGNRTVFVMFGKQFETVFHPMPPKNMIGCNLPIIVTERRHLVLLLLLYSVYYRDHNISINLYT